MATFARMLDQISRFLADAAEVLCGYPLFFLLIGGGLYLFISSGMVSLRRLPHALATLRQRQSKDASAKGQISSGQALASVVAATIGLGNIAGVAIALVIGGPGAIFWMWVSALVGMATKYHEGVLAIMYRGKDDKGVTSGGPMYIIDKGLGRRWHGLAVFFAVAGMLGTFCIMNANQLTEAVMTMFTTPEGVAHSGFLTAVGGTLGLSNAHTWRALFGVTVAAIVALVILGGIRRIAHVASVLVPFMVGLYFVMVLYIILTNLGDVPRVITSIFQEAFNLQAGFGALAGIAIIGARRAMVVNDAGVGTASIMHGSSANRQPVREGLVAMLGPAIDSGLVCTLTALAILLCGDPQAVEGVKGLEVALDAFARGIPGGEWMLIVVVICFALSSMFSYSYYGGSCAKYLFGTRRAKIYTYIFIASIAVFAVVPLEAAVSMCDLFYGLMAFPAMAAVLMLSPKVRRTTREYFCEKDGPGKTSRTGKTGTTGAQSGTFNSKH